MTATFHLLSQNDQWVVRREGAGTPASTHRDEREAIRAASSIAERENANLFLHEPGGTVRTLRVSARETVQADAHHVLSVGSRVSWGALLAGFVVAFTVYFLLVVLGVATGTTLRNEAATDELAVGAALWSIAATMIALFLGGIVTSRTTVGENTFEALTYGVLLWGLLLIVLVTTAGAGLDLGLGALLRDTMNASAGSGTASSASILRQLGLDETRIQELTAGAERITGRVSPAEAAWWSFGAILVSMFCAVIGAVIGAGPKMVLENVRRYRRKLVSA